MKKTKYLLLIILLALVTLVFIPNTSNAAVSVERILLTNDGSMKFKLSGLTLDTTHEYVFGFEKTSAIESTNWYAITDFTATTATVNITTNSAHKGVFDAGDKGYITIKDKTNDTIVEKSHEVDLKIPYLNVTNFKSIDNGRVFNDKDIVINSRICYRASSAYYQYEKITDQNIISEYKEIKKANGNFSVLQSKLKTTLPSESNWQKWAYWISNTAANGGCPVKTVNVPDSGLYYLWVYIQSDNVKDIYGYILVDNLEDEISLTSISLPSTQEVELGKTITLTPTFNPSNTTDKTITWTSSDESVATVNSNGVVTPKKVGSTIITVTSNVGKKTAKCTVTVKSTSNSGTGSSTTNGWTDTSNISIKLINDYYLGTYQGYKISIEGITTNKDSEYYLYLTNGKNKPNELLDNKNFDIDNKAQIRANGKEFQGYSKPLSNEGSAVLEKNGDIYAWIIESKLNSERTREQKFILEEYKVERLETLLKLTKRFTVFLFENESSVSSYNVNSANNKERKLKVKIGTIDDNSILKAIKDNESGALEKLLTYSKSAKSIYTGTLPVGKSASIIDKIDIVNKKYYYAYFELDDENGKYYPVEDVTVYQGRITQSKKLLYRLYDQKFTWNIDDNNSSTSTPTDTTITPDKKLPQTGEKIAIIGTIGIAVVVAVVLGIKAKKYNF